MFALLADRRRRALLRILQDFSTPISIAEVSEILADCEYEYGSDLDRRRVRLALHHNHLPRLADARVIDYDRASGSIEPDVNFGVLVGAILDDRDSEDRFAG